MVDFPRLKEGRLAVQFWSVYIPCPASDDFSSSTYHETIHDTFQQIDLVNRLIETFPESLEHAYSASDIWSNFKRDPGVISSLMGAEGLHQIGNSASIVRLYHSLGVRYVTLTHDCNNIYADAALAAKPAHSGLSAKGKEMVREMNRLGMMVDLSHTSDATILDALNISMAPVIFSHSNARALCDHVRNVPDSTLLKVRENRGVVMVTFYPAYTNNDPALASLDNVVDHIIHIGNTIGFEHVGIGSDFDGMSGGPRGLEDVSKYPSLIAELLQRGVAASDIEGVIGRNVLRVLAEVESVAKNMNRVPPLEDEVKPMPHLFLMGG
ncbi:Dipeptidase [Lachnellula willkommii]|uniref:Dipeptidase n=1 Tax=Lachnellula willkommii TaxID=215461 RepID=A0A559MLG1_9HELO|nr:Dipeptidase [Lachnellula willkommii]